MAFNKSEVISVNFYLKKKLIKKDVIIVVSNDKPVADYVKEYAKKKKITYDKFTHESVGSQG